MDGQVRVVEVVVGVGIGHDFGRFVLALASAIRSEQGAAGVQSSAAPIRTSSGSRVRQRPVSSGIRQPG